MPNLAFLFSRPRVRLSFAASAFAFLLAPSLALAAETSAVSRADALAALRKAVDFYRTKVSVQGSYGYRASADLAKREGEQSLSPTQGWIESPATPAVGLAYLEAYQLTREPFLLEAARETGHALVKGQLRSGGWCEFIEFDPVKRRAFAYRVDVPPAPYRIAPAAQQPQENGILEYDRPFDHEFNGREESTGAPINITTFDDDKSQGALRFLMLLDRELKFADREINAAVRFGQEGFLAAQYPNGGWPQHFRDKITPPQPANLKASYPERWSWTHKWDGYSRYYTVNDGTLRDLIRTMLLAHEIYGEERFLASAKRGGDFLILAQMPDPQPAWAQQYNFAMQPAWARIWEPPAVSGGESQAVMTMLIDLALDTGEPRFLEPIPRALAYLRASIQPNGQLARFYELRTNRPLFSTRKYQLTYEPNDLPTHYGFFSRPRLEAIAQSYETAKRALAEGKKPAQRALERERSRGAEGPRPGDVGAILRAMDPRGAWVEPGTIRVAQKERAAAPVIESRTFIRNLRALAEHVAATK